MNWSKLAKSAAIFALLASAPMPAGAMEGIGGTGASQANDTMVVPVYMHRGPGGGVYGRPGYHGGGVYHGGVYRGGVYRGGYGYHGGVYRPGYRGPVVVGGWNRPGWYRWGPGGAIAAGAAIGVLGAASVAAWAPPAPAPGLCWYYTDPSQRNGFWDACQ
jgi:hypothetical protein